MGCNCGNKTEPKQSFLFTAPDGKKTTYTSEVQARAAQIRSGGGTYQPVPR